MLPGFAVEESASTSCDTARRDIAELWLSVVRGVEMSDLDVELVMSRRGGLVTTLHPPSSLYARQIWSFGRSLRLKWYGRIILAVGWNILFVWLIVADGLWRRRCREARAGGLEQKRYTSNNVLLGGYQQAL